MFLRLGPRVKISAVAAYVLKRPNWGSTRDHFRREGEEFRLASLPLYLNGWRSAVNSSSQDPSKGTWLLTAREFQWLSRVSFVSKGPEN
jgi:hypothetical protein